MSTIPHKSRIRASRTSLRTHTTIRVSTTDPPSTTTTLASPVYMSLQPTPSTPCRHTMPPSTIRSS